jgi:hypothetical protein
MSDHIEHNGKRISKEGQAFFSLEILTILYPC